MKHETRWIPTIRFRLIPVEFCKKVFIINKCKQLNYLQKSIMQFNSNARNIQRKSGRKKYIYLLEWKQFFPCCYQHKIYWRQCDRLNQMLVHRLSGSDIFLKHKTYVLYSNSTLFIRKILISIPSPVFLQCPHHSQFPPCGGCYHRLQPVVQHSIFQQQFYCRIPQKPLSGPVEPKKRGV